MLKDSHSTYNLPFPNDLSVTPEHEVKIIFEFIDQYISNFSIYFQSNKDSEKENRITDLLVRYFTICIAEIGILPFAFMKNPSQPFSSKETDIGVYIATRSATPVTIIEFEAKRFSKTTNNKEYVCGIRGGIERFKRGEHASHLSICGMFGYIQSNTPTKWVEKVNNWISEMSSAKYTSILDWKNNNEKLVLVKSFQHAIKYKSICNRSRSLLPIVLYHYFIDLQKFSL